MSRSFWHKGEMGGVECPAAKPEALSPASYALTVTRGSTGDVVVVSVESVKKGGWDCETSKEIGRHGAMVMGVETMALGERIETSSNNSSLIGLEVGNVIGTSEFVVSGSGTFG